MIINIFRPFFFSLVLLSILATACFGPSMQSGGGIKKVETFYRGEGKTLYHIKAVTFKDDSRRKLEMDFTYNHNRADSLKDSVVANFSLYSKEGVKFDRLAFLPSENIYHPVSAIFKKNFKNKTVGRYTTRIPYAEFKRFINSGSPEILLISEGKEVAGFKAVKWNKFSAVVNEQVIEAVEFNF